MKKSLLLFGLVHLTLSFFKVFQNIFLPGRSILTAHSGVYVRIWMKMCCQNRCRNAWRNVGFGGLVILFALPLTAQEKPYAPMLGKEFSAWYSCGDYGKTHGGKFTVTRYSNGDTTINGQTYVRILSDRHSFDKGTTATESVDYLREDTAQRKVYSLSYFGGPEIVLYDFSLKPGDYFYLGQNRTMKLRWITYTYSVCYESFNTHNRVFHFLNLGNNKPFTWIEGVGSISDLYYYYAEENFDCDKLDAGLVCKVTDQSVEFGNDKFLMNYKCPLAVITHEQPKPGEIVLRVYPNPVRSKLRISGYDVGIGKPRYRIINMMGQIVKSGELDRSPETELDVSAFPPGVYIMKITNGNQSASNSYKFVVVS